MRITGDRGGCIGSGQCVRWAPELFDQDEELGQIVVLRDAIPEEGPDAERLAEALRNAVRACPSGALTVDADG
ncbi:MAG: ferredoxin [Acidimicrobiales bacterium]